MGAKRYRPEEIILKLREAEVLLAEGVSVGEVVRRLGVTQLPPSRCSASLARDPLEAWLSHAAWASYYAVAKILEDRSNGLTEMTCEIIADLFEFMLQLDARIKSFDIRIDQVFRANADCQWIAQICGVGSKTATAVVAAVGDGKEFKNGRHMAAWMGLVPRQHSSGDKRLLMGISKRGDKHLRTLLIHGARCVVRVSQGRTDAFSRWVNSIRERRA